MTQIIEQTTPSLPPQQWGTPAPVVESALDSYTRRIHWWVRLFGVFCIGWAALTLFAAVYLIAAASNTNNGDSAYLRCVSRGTSISTCVALYGD